MKISKKKLALRIIIISVISIILIFSIVSFFVVKSIFNDSFGRAEIPKHTAYLRYDDVKDKYEREDVTFKSVENKLIGHIYSKNETPHGLVVISHGLGGYSESYFSEIMYFLDNGYKVFAYDNTGSGESEGKGTTGMAQSVIDLDSALTFAESDERLNNLPILLFGHSWGGYAVTTILSEEHNITASLSLSGYNSPMEIISEFSVPMIGEPFATIEYPFMWLNNKLLFGEKANNTAVDGINATNTPVMIIHGTGDETIKYNGASIIAHRDEITNPNVIYRTVDNEQNGHNGMNYSKEAYTYIKELNKKGDELEKQYDGDTPDEVIKEFYDSIDKVKTSELSEDFMGEINEFYLKAIEEK